MVVVFGRRLSALQKTVDAIGADHCYAMSVDVSDEEQVKSAIAKVHEMFGTVDILANMAGIPGPSERVEDYTFADFKKVYSINVFGTFLTMKYCLPIRRSTAARSSIRAPALVCAATSWRLAMVPVSLPSWA